MLCRRVPDVAGQPARGQSAGLTLNNGKRENSRTLGRDSSRLQCAAACGVLSRLRDPTGSRQKTQYAPEGSVGEQRGIRCLADRTQMLDGIGDVGGAPIDDRCNDQVQAGRAILKRLVRPI